MTQLSNTTHRPRAINRLGKLLLIAILVLAVVCMTGWCTLFLYYSNLPYEWLRVTLAAAYFLGTVASFASFKNRRRTLLGFFCVFAALVVWFFCIPASNNRNWQTEVAVLPTATVDGHLVSMHNIRNFDYRSETNFTPRYYDKQYNLDNLESLDLIFVYWGNKAISHVMVSFGFGGNDYVTFSIELRKEKGEVGSMLDGFFRHYELVYVVGDERDLIRVRTNYRNPREQAYIYRTRLPRVNQRKLFLDYIRGMNKLARQPAWYNTLSDNCTTGVLRHTRSYPNHARYNWKLLLSGYGAEYVYDLGMLDSSMPFGELQEQCWINAKAADADQADDFSTKIRINTPKPRPLDDVHLP